MGDEPKPFQYTPLGDRYIPRRTNSSVDHIGLEVCVHSQALLDLNRELAELRQQVADLLKPKATPKKVKATPKKTETD